MYAQLLMFTLGPGTRSAAEKLADQFAPAHRAAKGYKGVTFFADYTIGEYGSFTLWESKEDLEAFRNIAIPKLEDALSGITPSVRTFEVYEPQ